MASRRHTRLPDDLPSMYLRLYPGRGQILKYCAVLSIFCSAASGATWYVDDANGSDASAGTSWGASWATIPYTWSAARAGNTIAEGDTVLFKDGDYGAFRESTDDGASYHVHRENWITYKAATGHEPNFTSVIIKNYAVAAYGESYLIFDGLTIVDGVEGSYSNYVKILNCTVSKIPLEIDGFYAPYFKPNSDYIVYFLEVNDVNVSNCEITSGYQGVRLKGPASGADIVGNTIHLIAGDCLSIGTTRDLLIDDNYMYDIDCRRSAIAIRGTQGGVWSAGEVLNQAVSGASGVYDSNTDIAIYAFITSEQEWAATNTIAVGLDEAGDNGTITGVISGATLTSLGVLDPSAHSECFEIMSYVPAYNSQNVTLSNNVGIRLLPAPWVQNSSAGKIEAKVGAEFTNLVVENNLFVSDSRPILLPGVSDFTLRNNTLVGGGSVRLHLTSGDPSSIIDNMYNNIFSGLVLDSDADIRHTRVISHGNNIFADDPNGDGGPTYPFDVNDTTEYVDVNLVGLFVDSANNDFNLVPASAAIDAGSTHYYTTTDILGVARDASPDMGAYEYVGAGGNQAPVLAGIGAKGVLENRVLIFVLTATDGDSDPLTFECSNLPTGATLTYTSPTSATFAWVPTYKQGGSYNLVFIVTDGDLQDVETVTVTVTNVTQYIIL